MKGYKFRLSYAYKHWWTWFGGDYREARHKSARILRLYGSKLPTADYFGPLVVTLDRSPYFDFAGPTPCERFELDRFDAEFTGDFVRAFESRISRCSTMFREIEQ